MSYSCFDTCDKNIAQNQSEAAEAAREISLPLGSDYNDVYLNFVKEAKAAGVDPEDIRAVLDILKKAQKRKEKIL